MPQLEQTDANDEPQLAQNFRSGRLSAPQLGQVTSLLERDRASVDDLVHLRKPDRGPMHADH